MSCRLLYFLPLSASIVLSALLVFGTSRAEAGTILWHWAGPVTGYVFPFPCGPGDDCGPRIETVVPLGTNVDVFVSLDPNAQPNANCLAGNATASFHVLGRTYTNQGFVWVDGAGFGPGTCAPAFDGVEVVVPAWGFDGPALPDGWVPFTPFFLPGLWWSGDLADGQPQSIASQFPSFRQPGRSAPQRFTADLQAVPADMHPVPEPATLTLFGVGLTAAWAARRRRRL